MSYEERVTAIVVTRDRCDLLMEALDAVYRQTRPPDAVLVVDNASTDGTARLVRERFPSVRLVALSRNTGGAGGFAVGITHAMERGAGLLWLMDDDTIPTPQALASMLDARERYPGAGPPALVASRVAWTDGRDHPMNTPRPRPWSRRADRDAAAAVGCRPIRSASFVSCLLARDAVERVGLPVADYFLWNDDFEFTTRVLRGYVGLYCPASVVVHKTRAIASWESDPGQRFFYEVRNKVWLFTRSRGLAPAERALYAGSTLRRWLSTFARSHDRVTLGRGLVAGLAAGLRAGPRDTSTLLSDVSGTAAATPVLSPSRPPSPRSRVEPTDKATYGHD